MRNPTTADFGCFGNRAEKRTAEYSIFAFSEFFFSIKLAAFEARGGAEH
jgi:hypothetical protein